MLRLSGPSSAQSAMTCRLLKQPGVDGWMDPETLIYLIEGMYLTIE